MAAMICSPTWFPTSVRSVGFVSPLGSEIGEVCDRIMALERLEPAAMEIPGRSVAGAVLRVPPSETIGREVARLRRSSTISLFACEAARRAIAAVPDTKLARTALIFASTNGAVIYTRKFYKDVAECGNGSPIFFPETVYNAPASHVAAALGIDGEVLTLVSDTTAACDALRMASELIASDTVETCLVVASEELDPITWEAYHRWGLARSMEKSRGAVLSEGAVALVLGRANPAHPQIERVHPGGVYRRSLPAREALREVFGELCNTARPDLVVSSHSGTRFDQPETDALASLFPNTPIVRPKQSTGEAFAVSALLQTAVAIEQIRRNAAQSILIPVTGWNGHVGGLLCVRPAA